MSLLLEPCWYRDKDKWHKGRFVAITKDKMWGDCHLDFMFIEKEDGSLGKFQYPDVRFREPASAYEEGKQSSLPVKESTDD